MPRFVFVVTYTNTGMVALPYAFINGSDAERAISSLALKGEEKEFKVRMLEVKESF